MASTSETPAVPAWRSLPRNVWATTLTSLLTDISTDMILNLVPLFLANVLGASTGIIGLIDGIAETTSSLLKVFSGWLSDRFQQRKWLAVAGYALSTFSKPFLYLVTTWTGVLLVRFFERAGKGIRTAPRDALIADSIDEQLRGAAFGLHRAGDTAGAVIGLVITLLVILAMQSQSILLNRETFQTLVLISIVPAFLAVLVLVLGTQDIPAKPRQKEERPRLTLGALSREFKIFLGIMALFTLGNSADSFLILRAQERGLSLAGIIAMLITFNVVYSAFSGPLGRLSDKVGRKRLLLAGWFVYGAIYLCFALVQAAWQVWLLYALYGLYYAAVEGTAKAFVADLIAPEQRGTAYGYYNAVIGLMALPASLLAGMLWQVFGAAAPFLMGALLAFLAALLLSGWQYRKPVYG